MDGHKICIQIFRYFKPQFSDFHQWEYNGRSLGRWQKTRRIHLHFSKWGKVAILYWLWPEISMTIECGLIINLTLTLMHPKASKTYFMWTLFPDIRRLTREGLARVGGTKLTQSHQTLISCAVGPSELFQIGYIWFSDQWGINMMLYYMLGKLEHNPPNLVANFKRTLGEFWNGKAPREINIAH